MTPADSKPFTLSSTLSFVKYRLEPSATLPVSRDKEPPNETELPFNVIAELANSAFATPPFLIVTAPLDTAKLSELNDATPLLDVVASSAEYVTVPELSATSIPSPSLNVIVPPNEVSV